MLSVIISWIYIFLICMLIGVGALSLFEKQRFSMTGYLIAGVVIITVYVEFFSIFAKIGGVSHVILLAATLLIGYRKRNVIFRFLHTYRPIIFSWEGFYKT